jgi:hypothetical protein
MAQPIFISEDWHRRVNAFAILAARKTLAAIPPELRLSDESLGKLVDATLAAWIDLRAEQAIVNGIEFEQLEKLTGQDPEPWDAAIVAATLPKLAELPLDWTKPITNWSREEMCAFICRALTLACKAQSASQRGSKHEFSDEIPL